MAVPGKVTVCWACMSAWPTWRAGARGLWAELLVLLLLMVMMMACALELCLGFERLRLCPQARSKILGKVIGFLEGLSFDEKD